MSVQVSRSDLLILKSNSQTGWCLAVQVSESDLLKDWRTTHKLDASGCSAVQVSGSDLLKDWRVTHKLDASGHSAIQVSGSNLQLICSNTREQLTFWMGVQPFWSMDLNTEE